MDHFTGIAHHDQLCRWQFEQSSQRQLDLLVSFRADRQLRGTSTPANVKIGWAKIEVGQTVPTDFNFDYHVDGSDFNIVKANMGTGGDVGTLQANTMSKGDANNDGYTDGSDFNAVKAAMGTIADTVAP